MLEESHFLREAVVDVNAAVVGIGRLRWVAVSDGPEAESTALGQMEANRFDVLPIEKDGDVREYFGTKKWGNFSGIQRHHIVHHDVIPFNTSIRGVIKAFAQENRNFFFLGNEKRIVGLITIANLNCRQVSIYLFGLVAALEGHLANFVSSRVSNGDLEDMVLVNKKVKKRYEADKKQGTDLPLLEYVYLSDLVKVIKATDLYSELGYSEPVFEETFGSLVKLRNVAAHPIKSVVSGPDSVADLWGRIDSVEAILFALR
jgi:hypothetical protein